MIEIELFGLTAKSAGRKIVIRIEKAATVSDAVRIAAEQYPEAAEKFFNGQALSKRIIIYVDDKDIRLLQGDLTVLTSESRIKIIPALTGG